MIKKANLEEAKLIYTKHMIKDFPDDEIPEYDRFIKLTEEKMHDIYLFEKDEKQVAYFISVEKNNNILITHLAVMEEFRSKGIGKIFLNEIKNYFSDKNMIIVEVEAEIRANNEEELNIIRKRKKYYLNSDFVQCDNMTYILYGVQYDILICKLNDSVQYNNFEIKKIIEEIYSKLRINESKLQIKLD